MNDHSSDKIALPRNYLLDFINLRDIRTLLNEVFEGYERGYVITSKISSVVLFEDNKEYHEKFKHIVSTMAIDDIGTLYVAEEYVNTYLESIDDLKAILLHELFHQVLGDLKSLKYLNKKDPDLGLKAFAINIATDCRINAFLYFFMQENGMDNSIFNRMYATIKDKFNVDDFLLKLLHQDSVFTQEEKKQKECIPLIKIHSDLYSTKAEYAISFQELYDHVLEYLMKEQEKYKGMLEQLNGFLIGNHKFDPSDPKVNKELGQKEGEDTEGDDLPDKPEEGAGDLISDIVNGDGTKPPGISNCAYKTILNEAQGIDQKIDVELFKRLSFDNLFTNIRLVNTTRVKSTVKMPRIPTSISKRDNFLLMNDIIPLLWSNPSYVEVKTKKMLPIYLDVSGSMYDALPEIIKLITNVGGDLEYVWGFSNKIYKHTMDDLLQNRIKSTGGTDFDCVIDHALLEGYNSIMVVTDGYAYCNKGDSKIEGLDEAIVVLCSDQRARENWLSKVYENTIDIEEVII